MEMKVGALYCYPIKSCGGIALQQTEIGPRGLRYDREWMIVDWDGKAMTQRQHPRLCLIGTAITDDVLEISAPGMPTLRLFIEDNGPRKTPVIVWNDVCLAWDQGMHAAAWFSDFLDTDCWLVRMPRDHVRPSRAGDGSQVGFADGHGLLVISDASLEDLNARLETPLPMDRFRPNIVVSGCDPYVEDGWNEIRVAGAHLSGANRCIRCVITTTDQLTGERGKEPLKTLAGYRKTPEGVVFGKNFNIRYGGALQVGDVIEIIG